MKSEFKQRYGPWAVVTGASEGIGRAIAKELANRGLNLVLIGRRSTTLAELANHLLKINSGISIRTLALDVSASNAMNVLQEFTETLEVGLFVGAAGFGSSGEFRAQKIENELNMIEVNCKAVVGETHYFLNQMIPRGRGGVILFSSLVAFQGVPYSATYSATKSFIQNFAEALHFETKSYGIDILATAPGPVNSGFANRAHMKMASAATPEEIASGTLLALGHRITVRPGFLSKLLGYSILSLNRWGRVQVMKKIMKGMAKI